MRITFDFYGDTQVDRTIARMQDRVEDATPVWETLVGRFIALEKRQFATQGAAASGGWAPLSPRYAAWKARHYPGKKILERTGALKRSLTQRPLPIEDLKPDSMVIGSDNEIGGYHQSGTDRMPRRRPVELTESARRDWVKRIQRYVLTGGVS